MHDNKIISSFFFLKYSQYEISYILSLIVGNRPVRSRQQKGQHVDSKKGKKKEIVTC